MDRLDNVIRVVNDHESESCQVGQSINDIQHELTSLRQTVDAWNQDDQHEGHEEDRQEEIQLGENPDLPLKDGHDLLEQDPPGLMRSASMAGLATTITSRVAFV